MHRSFEHLSPYVGRALGLSAEALERAYRPARERDLPGLLSLRRAVHPDAWWDDEAFVRWRYFGRPGPAGDVPHWVFERDGEILGACGLEPVTLVVDGSPAPAVRTLDIMVRPDVDGSGLGAHMNLELFRRFPVVLATGSNDRSHRLLMRLFRHATDLRFWKAPVRARAIAGPRLGPALGAIVSWPADVLLSLRRAARRRHPLPGVAIEELPAFDARVTALSRGCEGPGRVMVRRSEEYLNWRFVRNPRCRYRILGAMRAGRLEGYLVTRLNLGRPNPRREAEIVDWLAAPARPAGPSVLPALLEAAVGRLVRDGAGIISCAGADPELPAAMAGAGFHARPAERLPFFVKADAPHLESRLCRGGDWFLTRGDFDVE